jgi:transglutaminase-like putative cysteine protease
MANTTSSADVDRCREPTWFVDSDDVGVRTLAAEVCDEAGAEADRDKAVALFLAVRDGWRYDPYSISRIAGDYRASTVLKRSSAYCIPKAVLLSALCRAERIPARLGFADVRNHLQSEKLRERMGTDLFVFHGYSEVWLDGSWKKVSAAFNIEMCERFDTKVLDFDGTTDSLMHPFDATGNRHMEYVNQRGSYSDLPFDEIMSTFDAQYGQAMTEAGADGDTAFSPIAEA